MCDIIDNATKEWNVIKMNNKLEEIKKTFECSISKCDFKFPVQTCLVNGLPGNTYDLESIVGWINSKKDNERVTDPETRLFIRRVVTIDKKMRSQIEAINGDCLAPLPDAGIIAIHVKKDGIGGVVRGGDGQKYSGYCLITEKTLLENTKKRDEIENEKNMQMDARTKEIVDAIKSYTIHEDRFSEISRENVMYMFRNKEIVQKCRDSLGIRETDAEKKNFVYNMRREEVGIVSEKSIDIICLENSLKSGTSLYAKNVYNILCNSTSLYKLVKIISEIYQNERRNKTINANVGDIAQMWSGLTLPPIMRNEQNQHDSRIVNRNTPVANSPAGPELIRERAELIRERARYAAMVEATRTPPKSISSIKTRKRNSTDSDENITISVGDQVIINTPFRTAFSFAVGEVGVVCKIIEQKGTRHARGFFIELQDNVMREKTISVTEATKNTGVLLYPEFHESHLILCTLNGFNVMPKANSTKKRRTKT